MNTNKKIALASFAALILPIAMSAPANAITISTTPCVLNIPAKSEVVRGDLTGLYSYYGQFSTLKETDLTCPDVANPFKTTDISYTNSNGGGGSYCSGNYGGGGGGYSGGGGGNTPNPAGGGGGSFCSVTLTSSSVTNAGNGYVSIT